MKNLYTTREAAELLGVETWQVRRLFEDGTLAEPPKFGGKRAIPSSLVPKIRKAMADRGWSGVGHVDSAPVDPLFK